ncbi:MAG TPA: hypothetical protein VJ863_01455 [Sphaerochaeta sp.]|nr:hypothetical protein [Sphaerochaeta sp.]
MNKQMTLNDMGYVTNYLVSGPVVTPFYDDHSESNQLQYEKYLRSIIADKGLPTPKENVILGKKSRIGEPWQYYFSYGNWFVDYSTFYFTLQKIRIEAVTELVASRDCTVKVRLWSYAAIDMWCNNEHVAQLGKPCYKPIQYIDVTLPLHKGKNQLYLSLQNLGVRDTRTLFGLQVKDHRELLSVSLPENTLLEEFWKIEQWMDALKLEGRHVHFPSPAPIHTSIGYDSKDPDHAHVGTRIIWNDVSGKLGFVAAPGNPNLIVRVGCNNQQLVRNLEIAAEVVPRYGKSLSVEQNRVDYYERMAAIESLDRGGAFGFSMPHILARRAVGKVSEQDRKELFITLQQIDDRYDCSDFLLCGLIRYIKNYPLDEELQARIDEVLLRYRYWMTMKGSDAMCFWSENHALQFYSCAYLVGNMYPTSYFSRAERTGKDLSSFGKEMLHQWFAYAENHGFEEFLSTCYMCVTFASLVNLVDYGEKDISKRATATLDKILRMLSLHTFDGSILAPMGRIYRNIIYPFDQGAQVLMNLANPSVPICDEESWLASYATSSYLFPSDLTSLMERPVITEYGTGSALVRLEKTPSYTLTSVQSPREDGFVKRQNLTLVPDADQTANAYVRSLNERFHGTTCFEPGVYGYQQHMWAAALSKEAIMFANHPGGTYDSSTMRPGYWYGNGIMPAVKQERGCIGSIYSITEEHPIHFIHVYLPSVKFDSVEKDGQWLFAQKGNGMLALWCSSDLVPYNDQLTDCEWRAYTDLCAFMCYAGEGDAQTFKAECLQKNPRFDLHKKTLSDQTKFSLTHKTHQDETQYM